MTVDINQAAQIIKSGGIVLFPTDTAYGMGCRIDDEKAIDRLFRIRRRPADMPTPVLVSTKQMAVNYFEEAPKWLRRLMDDFWPGALTIIFRSIASVNLKLLNSQKCLGLRMPDHPVPLGLIGFAGVPIIGTSANFHGQPTPYKFEEVDRQLIGKADGIVAGDCFHQQASTIIDCSQIPYQIIRQGPVMLDLNKYGSKQ